ncbi:head maturation protease, ClpP-related [Paracoccus aminophilus]|uniref:ATP-dependent Clp protease proteolytic subunit n=1 Tax=Paracoccus aminophilus JCM 7686 TaxID=1367847 RepID=S5YA94_PARAH|nr:head maturation protease, ClpP-related [Paracoccus aminophilus]AGT08343.1 peptidase S14 [Paracoccus aminophilus JCM 7686]AGT10548.1 peptidase S14 [Paracoccus aminophilus JCM 7686]AGT10581.1 peptidase S14 [Paracoccus aminophilus JCM 7686]
MSLRKLPEIAAARLPTVCAFEPDADAVERWSPGMMAAVSGETTISILDVIGEDYWTGGGVTSKRVAAALRAIGDQDVVVDINSPGGDFFEGVAIYNALRAHPRKVTVRVIGLAASAASIIAMAGDEIQIGKAGFLMIHNSWVMAIGNRHDLADAARTMEPFDDAMATVYSDRAGATKAKVTEWMDGETWFNGEQAVQEGLADAFLAADAVAEDKTKAEAARGVNATRRIDARLAKTGMPRTERRALLAELKGGTPDAAPPATHDAGALVAALAAASLTIRS